MNGYGFKQWVPQTTDSFISNKYASRREHVTRRTITTTMSPVPNFVFLEDSIILNIMLIFLLLAICARVCITVFMKFDCVMLNWCLVLVQLVVVILMMINLRCKLRFVTLCQVATTQAGGLVNFDPRSQPGAVTKLINPRRACAGGLL